MNEIKSSSLTIVDKIAQSTDLSPETENELWKAILHLGKIKTSDAYKMEMLNALKSIDQLRAGREVAFCFIRILKEPNFQFLDSSEWRPFLINLFEKYLPKMMESFQISSVNQSFQKISLIIDGIDELENSLYNKVRALTNLELANKYRQAILKFVKSKNTEPYFLAFLPADFESSFNALFVNANNYLTGRDSLDVVNRHRLLQENITSFRSSLLEIDSKYSQWFSEFTANRLESLLAADFSANKAVQPTTLSLTAIEKKYPLDQVGQEFLFKLALHNSGPGYANNIKLTLLTGDEVEFIEDYEDYEISINRMPPHDTREISFPLKVKKQNTQAYTILGLNWENFDGSLNKKHIDCVLQAQKSGIDWETHRNIDPYPLEAVQNEQKFVGRKDIVEEMLASITTSPSGSFIIQGQKRVGKTSIARAIESNINLNEELENYIVVFIELGQSTAFSSIDEVRKLGRKIVSRIKFSDKRLEQLEVPTFKEGFSDLYDFIEEVLRIDSSIKIVIIIDEFDELAPELYTYNQIGSSLFLTFRSLSSLNGVSFILVGGEKMKIVLDYHGSHLNKWTIRVVDYFSKENAWDDYCQLIQKPAQILEFTDGALQAIYKASAGNPYFTNQICGSIFRLAVQNRDSHVTKFEVQFAIRKLLSQIEFNTFVHFWDDGLLGLKDETKLRSVKQRKRFLIALSDSLRKEFPSSKQLIAKHSLAEGIVSLDHEIQDFLNRKIIIQPIKSVNAYEFKVRYFSLWLEEYGVEKILLDFADRDFELKQRILQEEQRVKAEEIIELIERIKVFKDRTISEDRVRMWLNQFESNREKRLMFKLLENLRFYSNEFVRNKLEEADKTIKRGVTRFIENKTLKRSDILVSYLDKPSKSGAYYSRLYADEASIYVDNIVEKGKIKEALQRPDIKVLVFVDDFVSTGNSAISYLQELDQEISELVLNKNIKVVFVAIIGYEDGWKKVEAFTETLIMPVQTYRCEPLTEDCGYFSDKSTVFQNQDDKDYARSIALTYGKKLEKKIPLGYGNQGLGLCLNVTVLIIHYRFFGVNPLIGYLYLSVTSK